MICFEIDSRYTNFCSGEKTIWTVDGEYLYCQNSNEIIVVSVLTGKKVRKIVFNDDNENMLDNLLTFDLCQENVLITAHRSGLLKMWTLDEPAKQKRKWKSNHLGPILNVKFSPNNKFFCSVGADANIQFWDLVNNFPVCVIKENGIVSVVSFSPDVLTSIICVAGHDNIIRCYNYSLKQMLHSFKGHISTITSLAFSEERVELMASVSTDEVMIVWNILENTQLRVIPLFESLHGVFFMTNTQLNLPNVEISSYAGNDIIVAAGINGNIFLVNSFDYKIICSLNSTQSQLKTQTSGVNQLIICRKSKQFALVTTDHKICFYDYCTFKPSKNVIGCNKEILDMCFLGEKNEYLALATTDKDINIYEALTMNCVIASEHQDKVLTLSAFENYLLSAGKDTKISIWKLDPAAFSITCVAKCIGHTSVIKSICSSNHCFNMFASASEDGFLKLWTCSRLNLTSVHPGSEYKFLLKSSIKAHEQAIYSVAFSPNNNIIATASQDKTIKVWNCQNLSLVGTLQGHQRGVKTVRFSPLNQVLVSSSYDCSLRTWSLTTLECLTKIEEKSTALRLEFLAHSKLFISGSSSGVIKIWSEESTVPIAILEEHIDGVNALAIKDDGTGFYSGGSDPDLIYWKDVTTQKAIDHMEIRNKENSKLELLNNSIKDKHNEKTFRLALELNKPFLAYKIIGNLIRKRHQNSFDFNCILNQDINLLETHIAYWNTNNRYCKASQLILQAVINNILSSRSKVCSYKKFVKGVHSYSERHYKRMCYYVKELNFIDYVINCMA